MAPGEGVQVGVWSWIATGLLSVITVIITLSFAGQRGTSDRLQQYIDREHQASISRIQRLETRQDDVINRLTRLEQQYTSEALGQLQDIRRRLVTIEQFIDDVRHGRVPRERDFPP